MNPKIRKLENFHILLWLIKDTCWVTLSKQLGVFMIIPTLSLAIYITYIHRNEMAELVHNLAVCLWITANSVWMIGEFFFNDTFRAAATIFFLVGLLIMMLYYIPAFFRKEIQTEKKV